VLPSDPVIVLPAGQRERCLIPALHSSRAAGEGVVEDGGGGDGAVGEVAGFLELAEFFPTLDRARDFSSAVGQGEGDLRVFLAALAREAGAG
jgi:hypothetical protein